MDNTTAFIPRVSSLKLGVGASLSQPCSDSTLYFGNWQIPSVVPCFTSAELSAASLALCWVKDRSSAGGRGAPGDTWAAGTCGAGTAPLRMSPGSSPDPAQPNLLELAHLQQEEDSKAGWSCLDTRAPLPLCSPIGFGPPLPWGSVGEGSGPLSKQSQS